MAGNRQLARTFGYGLRMAWGSFAILSSFFRLTRLADEDAKTIRDFRLYLKRQGYRLPRAWGLDALTIPLRHYRLVCMSLPRLAGKDDGRFAQDMERKLHLLVESVNAGAKWIPLQRGGAAHAVQKKFIKHLFMAGFGLNLLDGQLNTLSRYPDSTVLFREFFDYCQSRSPSSSNWLGSRDSLREAVSDFEKTFHPDTEILPEFEREKKVARVPSAWVGALRPSETMVGFYNGSKAFIEGDAYQNAPTWILDELDGHLKRLEGLSILDFRTALLCEMHLRSCALLCKTGSMVPDDADFRRSGKAFVDALDRLWTSLRRSA